MPKLVQTSQRQLGKIPIGSKPKATRRRGNDLGVPVAMGWNTQLKRSLAMLTKIGLALFVVIALVACVPRRYDNVEVGLSDESLEALGAVSGVMRTEGDRFVVEAELADGSLLVLEAPLAGSIWDFDQ